MVATCVILAAKLDTVKADISKIIKTVKPSERKTVIALEKQIIIALDCSLHNIAPIDFLDRFLRIFGMDQYENMCTEKIVWLAKGYCRFTSNYSSFLKYKPSQIAAASLCLSIGIIKTDFAAEIGLTKVSE